ncbi:MAG: hypothetical protein AAB393_07205 [Bacteroidota bacterium]
MIPCDFTIVVRATAEDRARAAALLRTLPQTPADYFTFVKFDSLLTDVQATQENTRQTWCWLYDNVPFINEVCDELVVRAWMRNAPPFLLMMELLRRFPALTFDCFSVTDQEEHEHWRVGSGVEKQCELIEEVIINLHTDECSRHYLKDGEVTSYGRFSNTQKERRS